MNKSNDHNNNDNNNNDFTRDIISKKLKTFNLTININTNDNFDHTIKS